MYSLINNPPFCACQLQVKAAVFAIYPACQLLSALKAAVSVLKSIYLLGNLRFERFCIFPSAVTASWRLRSDLCDVCTVSFRRVDASRCCCCFLCTQIRLRFPTLLWKRKRSPSKSSNTSYETFLISLILLCSYCHGCSSSVLEVRFWHDAPLAVPNLDFLLQL